MIFTRVELVFVQPLLLVTVTVRVNEDPVPAEYVIFRMFDAEVMEPPLLIDHEYKALLPASGTDAEFPVEEAHTEGLAVMAAEGNGFIGIVLVLVLEQEDGPEPIVTVTVKVSEGPLPAV